MLIEVNDVSGAHVDAMVGIGETRRNEVCAQRRLLIGCQASIAAERTPNTPPVRLRHGSIAPTADPRAWVDESSICRYEHVTSRLSLISRIRLGSRGVTCGAIRLDSSMAQYIDPQSRPTAFGATHTGFPQRSVGTPA